jgi:hypothetical protein
VQEKLPRFPAGGSLIPAEKVNSHYVSYIRYFGGRVRTKDTARCIQSFSALSESSALDKTITQPFIGRPVMSNFLVCDILSISAY